MSSTHQLHTYATRDFTPDERKVAEYIMRNPGCTRNEIAKNSPISQKSSVSGRVGDLKARGCLIAVDAPGGEQLTFDPVEANWPAKARAYAASRHPVTRCAEWLKKKNALTPARRAVLEGLYLETKNL